MAVRAIPPHHSVAIVLDGGVYLGGVNAGRFHLAQRIDPPGGQQLDMAGSVEHRYVAVHHIAGAGKAGIGGTTGVGVTDFDEGALPMFGHGRMVSEELPNPPGFR